MAMTGDQRTADERAMAEVVHQLRAENKTLELQSAGLRRTVRWQNAVVCGLAFLTFTGMYACRIYGEKSALARRCPAAVAPEPCHRCPEPLAHLVCHDFVRGHASKWTINFACPHPEQHMVLSEHGDGFTLVKCLCDRRPTSELGTPQWTPR